MSKAVAAAVNREEWIKRRKRGIGASESPAVLGVSPFQRPYELWAEKCGLLEAPDLSGNEAVEFGIRLERPIAEAFAERTGRNVELWPQYQVAQHPQHDWFICTPDATQVLDGKVGLLQIKTTSAWNASDWADGPPLYYQVQVMHELAVTGYEWTSLVVLIGGQRLRYFDIVRNERFIDALVPQLEAFWDRVQTRQHPEVDGSLATAKALAKLHPEDSGETVLMPAAATQWTQDLETIKTQLKELEEQKTDRENRLKAALGDATFGLLEDGSRWSWKTQNRASYVVKETTFRILRKVK